MVPQENKGMESSTNYKLYNVSITFIQCSIALHVMQQTVQKYLLYLAVLSLFRFLVYLCIQQIQYENFFKQACFHPFWVSNMFPYSLCLRSCPLFYSMMQFCLICSDFVISEFFYIFANQEVIFPIVRP